MKRRLEIEDIYSYFMPHSLACNEDGVPAMIVSKADKETNSYKHRLYIYRNAKMQCLFEMERAGWFIWEDNDHILLPEKTDTTSTVLVKIDVNTGMVVWRSQEIPLSVRSIKRISGDLYAVTSQISCDCPDYYKYSQKEKEAFEVSMRFKNGYEEIDELPFWTNGGTYCSRKRSALFTVNISTGDCFRVTSPYFQMSSYCVIGGIVYYCGEEYLEKASLVNSIFSYTPGTQTPVCLYDKHEYNMGNGNATDQGGLFAWNDRLMMIANKNLYQGRRFHKTFYTVDKQTGDIRSFCDYQYSTTSIIVTDMYYGGAEAFVPAEDKCYFRSTINNEAKLMALHEDGTVTTEAENGGMIFSVGAGNGRVFVTAFEGQALAECYQAENGRLIRISQFNTGVLDQIRISTPEPIRFNIHNWDIDGFVMLPVDYDPGKKYPAILNIHGGPNTAYGSVFYHENQVWASRGFFVFYCNPEGSEGRGDEFLNIYGHFGQQDYETIMTFTDIILEKYPAIDGSKVCVTGGSYGGFMTNWIVGHADRFAAAASQRSISNWMTMQTVSDIGYHFGVDSAGADFIEDYETVWNNSPIKYVKNVKTPTLLLHSDADYRCPVDQGIQFFSSLKSLGVDSRLVIFHGEHHGMNKSGKPSNRIKRIQEITDWFERYTK